MAEKPVEQPVSSQGASQPPPDPDRVAKGYRVLMFAFVVLVVAVILDMNMTAGSGTRLLSYTLTLTFLIVSIVGSVMICRALGYSIVAVIACAIAMFIPLVDLLVMLLLAQRAMKVMRAAGYKIGFIGASKPSVAP